MDLMRATAYDLRSHQNAHTSTNWDRAERERRKNRKKGEMERGGRGERETEGGVENDTKNKTRTIYIHQFCTSSNAKISIFFVLRNRIQLVPKTVSFFFLFFSIRFRSFCDIVCMCGVGNNNMPLPELFSQTHYVSLGGGSVRALCFIVF